MIAASVGVKIPARIPPRMTTTVKRDRNALLKEWNNAEKPHHSSFPYPRFLLIIYTMVHIAIAMIAPGTAPAIKRRPIDTDATVPYTTAGTLGGMIGPTREDAPVTAREKSSS